MLLQELHKVKCPTTSPNKEKNFRSLKIQKQWSQIWVDTTWVSSGEHCNCCCKDWGCWRWWERKDYWWLKQYKWTRNGNPCCWSCSKLFARFPNRANEGEEVIPSFCWLAIEQVHKLGSDCPIKMGHSFSGKGMSTTKISPRVVGTIWLLVLRNCIAGILNCSVTTQELHQVREFHI